MWHYVRPVATSMSGPGDPFWHWLSLPVQVGHTAILSRFGRVEVLDYIAPSPGMQKPACEQRGTCNPSTGKSRAPSVRTDF